MPWSTKTQLKTTLVSLQVVRHVFPVNPYPHIEQFRPRVPQRDRHDDESFRLTDVINLQLNPVVCNQLAAIVVGVDAPAEQHQRLQCRHLKRD